MRHARSRTPRGVGTRWLLGVGGVILVAATGSELEAQSGDLRLLGAVMRQDAEAVSTLVEQQVDLDATQADGATALHWAVYLDDLDVARRLILAGADAAASNDHGVTPLSLACTNANAAVVRALLAAGADANAAVASGENVLMTCARTGNVDAVEALLAAGARVDAKEFSERQSALMWAVAQRHTAVVRVLIEHGADVQARSTVRRLVISRRLQSELKYGELGRSYGTDAQETDVGGFTPLLFAARHGDIESARLLLAAGASINDTAPDGSSVVGRRSLQRSRGAREVLARRGRQFECRRRWVYGVARRRDDRRSRCRRGAAGAWRPAETRRSPRPPRSPATARC